MTPHIVYESPDGTPFPVDWANDDLAGDQWRWDQVHNPTPLTPLAQDMIAIKRKGMYRGGDATGRPFNEERMYANGYGFSRSLEGSPHNAELARKIAARDRELRIDRLTDLWESSYRPETEALTRSLLKWAAPGDSLSDLLDRYDQVEAAWRRCGELHTISTGLASAAMREFDEFCTKTFGDEGARIAVESIAGMPNMSVGSAVALWELSRQVGTHPAVADLLSARNAKKFLSELDGAAGGAAFRSELDLFLERWGQRNESYYEVGFPTWREDPGFVLDTIRAYLDAPDEQSPLALHRRAITTRNTRTEEVKSRIAEPELIEEFLTGQRRAQQYTVLMEDHNYYIDQRAYTSLRTPHLALGERLTAAGALDRADDVFYLHVSEIKKHADHPDRKYQELVANRRAERAAWMHVLPPPFIGGDAPLRGGAQRAQTPVTTPPETTSLKGLAASAGTVIGVARVILSLDESNRLSPGEILVTYATAPPWTPLFAVAAAVVTDAGGPLAHCAVVAREYDIPAIVGAATATSVIKDGMKIKVDGTSGVVTILK
ncbi:MAG: PEP-utilizing enzyme [Dehalococcoidia bacterium]|jgi:pyruvate,water dikinase|nr:PEP-utilizing enzyme [Dehalococcoidia bacterium]